MSLVYELKVEKKGDGHEIFYVTGEGVFAAHKSGRLEKIFDPMMYSWNVRNGGNVYLNNLTGEYLEEVQRKMAEIA